MTLKQLVEKYIMKIQTVNIMTDIAKMREDVEQRQKEVLHMIEALSEAPSSDRASTVWKF